MSKHQRTGLKTVCLKITNARKLALNACHYINCHSIKLLSIYIKTHGRVSAAKEVVWHTSVLFTGTAKSPFSTPHTSITLGPISIKFTYFMPSIYTTLHTKFEENQLSSL